LPDIYFKWLEQALTNGLSQFISIMPAIKDIIFAFEMMTPEAGEKHTILKNAVDQFR